jgi:CheY-like chemotaxis protein
VLVVDDDPLVLAGNRTLLEELGCTVTSVSDSRRALAALADLGGEPVLVLCDMWLGEGENGIDLLRQATALAAAQYPVSDFRRHRTSDAACGRRSRLPALNKSWFPRPSCVRS